MLLTFGSFASVVLGTIEFTLYLLKYHAEFCFNTNFFPGNVREVSVSRLGLILSSLPDTGQHNTYDNRGDHLRSQTLQGQRNYRNGPRSQRIGHEIGKWKWVISIWIWLSSSDRIIPNPMLKMKFFSVESE